MARLLQKKGTKIDMGGGGGSEKKEKTLNQCRKTGRGSPPNLLFCRERKDNKKRDQPGKGGLRKNDGKAK